MPHCPRLNCKGTLEVQHMERIVCVACGWHVERIEAGTSNEARAETMQRLEMIR